MKKLLLVSFALIAGAAQAQRWGRELSLNYVNVNPVGGMGEIIQRGHGVSFQYGFVTPDQRLSFGADISYAQYGRDKSRQEYTFDDGTVAPMEIIVSNYFVNFTAYTRWYLKTTGSIRPFLFGRLGYSKFNTDLNIYDPDDDDHCEPVEHDVLYKDGTMIGAAGAGVKLDIGLIFKKLRSDVFYLEGTFNFMQGGQVSYMNADAETNHHHSNNDADHVMADFINTDTQVVHEHHVGYLYRNSVQMTEVRMGFSMFFAR